MTRDRGGVWKKRLLHHREEDILLFSVGSYELNWRPREQKRGNGDCKNVRGSEGLSFLISE